jgi:hypothetical protein
LLPE